MIYKQLILLDIIIKYNKYNQIIIILKHFSWWVLVIIIKIIFADDHTLN
jgi:hypothetical protein